jgi:TolB-like protein/Flp pilus assembly protein TadD
MDVVNKSHKVSKATSRTSQVKLPTNSAARVYQFDSFLLDQVERRLLRDGTAVELRPKAFDLLSVLVERAGHLVTKEALLEKVWPDAFVEEANLSVNITMLRRALGQRTGGQQYIKTVRKLGYRFVAEVLEVNGESALKTPGRKQQTTLVVVQEHKLASSRDYSSLAVLPFENESGEPGAEYLSDGLTESIINGFSHLEDFRVLGRNTVFRYKATTEDPQKIGEALGVSSLLTGRVLRLDDQVIVRAAVIDVKNGWQIWGEQYHRKLSDVLAVQEEIAEEISAKLRLKLTTDEKRRLTKRYTDNSAAYHFYLKGRYHLNKYAHKGLGLAIDCFRRAIEEDPIYALAYAGLSDGYYRLSNLYSPTTEAMPKAKLAAQRALEIDEALAEAHAALGSVLMFYDWDWAGARRELSRAIELNPGCAFAHQRLAQYLNFMGSFAEALHEYEVALDLDPLSPAICLNVALEFFFMGDYEQAIRQAEKTLEIDPTYHPTHYLMGWIHKRRGDFSKALDSFERVMILDDSSLFLAALGHAYGLNGDDTRALTIVDQLEKRSKHQYVSSYCRALVYIGLDEKDLAFQWLERAFEERSEMIPWLKVGADCDSLRSDPRLYNLLYRCGLEPERVGDQRC